MTKAEYNKKYNEEHKEEKKVSSKKYYQEHKDKIKERRLRNKDKIKAWRLKNKEKIRVKKHAKYLKNKEKIIKHSAEYYQLHREHADAKNREYHSQHPEQRLMDCINQRCNNPNSEGYKTYGAKGIKNLLTLDQLKFLMLYYNYQDMKDLGLRPHIHRRDSNDNYEVTNVCFLPAGEHRQLHRQLNKEEK